MSRAYSESLVMKVGSFQAPCKLGAIEPATEHKLVRSQRLRERQQVNAYIYTYIYIYVYIYIYIRNTIFEQNDEKIVHALPQIDNLEAESGKVDMEVSQLEARALELRRHSDHLARVIETARARLLK